MAFAPGIFGASAFDRHTGESRYPSFHERGGGGVDTGFRRYDDGMRARGCCATCLICQCGAHSMDEMFGNPHRDPKN
jgi:hypothetical protein